MNIQKLVKNKAFIASRNFKKIVISAKNFEKILAHLAVQTLAVFSNFRLLKNCQCFADDCIRQKSLIFDNLEKLNG